MSKKIVFLRGIIFCISFFTPFMGWAAESSLALKSQEMSLLWCLPFLGILLSLAILPLLCPRFWHAHYGKIGGAWGLMTILGWVGCYGPWIALEETLFTTLHHYLPFILLVLTLYTISGGLHLELKIKGTPFHNTVYLACATFIASWIGTTGAAMLFLRPLLKINQTRLHKSHTVIFFIFLVCNIGGSLTALGDPPLFLGFLEGVPFFWPFWNLGPSFVVLSLSLLGFYFFMDRWYVKKENYRPIDPISSKKICLSGKINLVWLGGVIGAVLLSGLWKPSVSFTLLGVSIALENLVRDGFLLLLTFLSWTLTPQQVRRENEFSWAPFKEVAKLFAAIFITVSPVILILKAADKGALSPLVSLIYRNPDFIHAMYFWLTGLMSAFLDNAPTYLVFFNLAGGQASELTTSLNCTLIAISAGSVFMGALSYIGNAPNFLVKAIAEENNIQMPSFFGYMGWSFLFLIPLFLLLMFLFLC